MLFNSWPFVALVLGTLVLYYLPPLLRWQPLVLIAASFIFYAYERPWLLTLLLASIAINVGTSYLVATDAPGRQRFWAVLGVTLNLSLLLVFKYSPLLARTFFPNPGDPHSLGHFLLNIPLPIGISFFTFQGISLVVEVFRARPGVAHDKQPVPIIASTFREHLRNTALFKAFFPQLIAGPIVKAHEFYPQIHPKHFRDIEWESVFRALVVGYFLKMVIADNLADETSWLVYPIILQLSRTSLAALLLGYSMQIFADFAGYSLIAIGWARLFGYKLPTNFNFPYVARSFSEFWRRWHISLSTWLREYLYVPLGGNRKGPVRTYYNLFIVMFLGGLWHGAAWSYAVWGTAHGAALGAERFLSRRIDLGKSYLAEGFRWALVFGFVTAAWLLFKLPRFEHVIAYWQSFWRNTGETQAAQFTWICVWVLPVIGYYLLHLAKRHPRLQVGVAKYEFLAFGAMLFGIVLNSGLRTRFIYFQF